LRDFKDVTFQITTKGKLGVFYPKETPYSFFLEKVKPLLVKADGTPSKIIDVIKPKSDQKPKDYSTPRLKFEITQRIRNIPGVRRQLPRIGFNIFPNPNDYPIRVRVEARTILGGKSLGLIRDKKRYYSGETEWNLNPGDSVWNANFDVPKECVNSTEELTIEVRATIIDQDNREHTLLPRSWTYMRKHNMWYYEPKSFTNGK